MENKSKFMRAIKASPDELDNVLCKVQSEGNSIYQVIPCPKSVDYSQHDHVKGVHGAMEMSMELIVLYVPTKANL